MDLLKSSQKKVDKASRTVKNAMKERSGRRLAVNFLILSVNLLIIILYFALARATIVLTPAEEEFKHQLAISVADGQTNSSAVSGTMNETTVNLEQTFAATGTKEVEAQAAGEVIVYNTTSNRAQPLVATTQFVNEASQIVRIREGLTIAAGQTMTVAAYADKAGKAGEVEPGRFQILKLKGARNQIYGVVRERFTGGVKSVKIVSADDLTRARAEMEQKFKLLAQEKLSVGQEKISPEDITLNITRYDASTKAGQPADNFTVKAEATAKTFTYDKEAAKEIIKADLANNLPPDKTLIEVVDDSFVATPDPDTSDKTLNAAITARLRAQIPNDVINNKKALSGLSRDEVRAYFTKIAGVKKVAVQFWPFWVRSVPKSENHIKIEVTQ